jgi:hypothetical protein
MNRTAMSLWTVCGNVGGIQQVFLLVSVIIFSYYSKVSFIIESSCAMFDVKSKDSAFKWEKKEIQVGFHDKIKLIFNLWPNKKLKRLVDRGEHKLDV